MKTKKLGWTELNISTIGLGTWAIGGGGWSFGWGPQDEKYSISTILHSFELGINWIDTAAVYGLGNAEKVVGKAIKQSSFKPILATKCGLIWDKNGNISGRLKKESVRSEIEASLKRLDVETIDLYQIHWPEPDEDIEQAWEVIAKSVKQGKIRYAGVSNFTIEQIKRVQSIHPVASVQPPYNMFRREIEGDILSFCAENNIGVIVYSPMERGLLSGKFSKQRINNLPEDDHRKNDQRFQEPDLSINLSFVDKLRYIAEKNRKTVAQLSIAWVLRRPEVTAAIVGARKPFQIEETYLASEWELSKEDISLIDELLNERQKMLVNQQTS